jgi:hypothetical protein
LTSASYERERASAGWMGNHDFEGDDAGVWMEEGRLL